MFPTIPNTLSAVSPTKSFPFISTGVVTLTSES
jgi:hypothetical protein